MKKADQDADKSYGLSIKITKSESDKVQILKEKHYLNLSALIRHTINEMYDKLEAK